MQVAPFRKLRKQKSEAGRAKLKDFVKYDMRQMHVAFTGTVPLTSGDEGDLVRAACLCQLSGGTCVRSAWQPGSSVDDAAAGSLQIPCRLAGAAARYGDADWVDHAGTGSAAVRG